MFLILQRGFWVAKKVDLEMVVVNILDRLAGEVIMASTHKERKRINKLAYKSIRNFYDNPKDIKRLDDYFQYQKLQ